jgi:hypothetical protein
LLPYSSVVSDIANTSANISAEDAVSFGVRRPGRPRGSLNKVTKDLRESAAKYTTRSLRVLWKLASESSDEMVKLRAACELLDRAHGRPSQVQLIGGTGQPIQSEQLTVEISQRLSQVFATVDTNGAKPVAESLDDQSLRAVSAVSFLAAQAASRGEATEVPPPPGPGPAGDPSPRAPEGDPVKTPIVDLIEEPEAPEVGHTLAFESDLTIIGLPPSRPGLPCGFELRRRGMRCRSGSWPLVLEEARKLSGGDLGPWIVQAPRAQTGQHYNTREQTITGIRRRASRSG